MNHLIECTNLSKNFGPKQALKDVSFKLDGHDLNSPYLNNKGATALVGPNGAGKTTLFSIMCNYQLPSSGRIAIFGHAPGSRELLGRVSALPQDAQLDPRFAISHQLGFYAKLQGYSTKAAKMESQRVLELVDLAGALNERPDALSHGMRKRVAIAQAFIGQPQLVLLDEPTAGLDPANARKVRQLVTDLSDQASFIISSHNLSELEQLCSTVLMLDRGVLSQQAIGETSSPLQQITLLLAPQTKGDALSILQNLPQVVAVKRYQKYGYILSYNAAQSPQFDVQLLEGLHRHNLQYRQLVIGVSLEQQLFSEP